MRKHLWLVALCWAMVGPAKAQLVTVGPEDVAKAKEIVEQMTLEEKLDYIGGYDGFYIRAVPRLGLPQIRMADGPQGVRNDTKSTLYPSGICSAATWNRALIQELGKALGQDCRARGVHVLLGPGVNIYRSPLCGRNFEYFGEDPYLASETAKEYIVGVQSQKVVATIKHFAANNQEWNRYQVSSDVDERTLQEIYFPTFRKAVQEAHVGAVMNSYNLVNGVHATQHDWMNREVLREAWGFQGILMSDWVSVHSAVDAANGGLDLEMPSGAYMNKENLLPAIADGRVTEQTIDLKVQHILQTLSAFGLLEQRMPDTSIPEKNPYAREVALRLAREGVVMLKNEDKTLPLKGKVAVLGPNADRVTTGGGSGNVHPFTKVSVAKGLQTLLDDELVKADPWKLNMKEEQMCYMDATKEMPGFRAEYFDNPDLKGKPVVVRQERVPAWRWGRESPDAKVPVDNFSARWTTVYYPAEDGMVTITLKGDDGYRMTVNGEKVIDEWHDQAEKETQYQMRVKAGERYDLCMEYYEHALDATFEATVRKCDEQYLQQLLQQVQRVVLCVGFDGSMEGEGFDRSWALPASQVELIEYVAKRHRHVTVVVNAGGGIDFAPWMDKVEAVLMAWYSGQEGGQAIAEILTGAVCPSGKLPISIERRWEDNPVYENYYDKEGTKRVAYKEGIFMGYRGYDRTGVKPLFPFGYGLSYTTFDYRHLQVKKVGAHQVEVTFDITNTGRVDGMETAQVYVHDVKSAVSRPLKELKGYEKVFLKRGEKKTVTVTLDEEAFSYYDVESKKFIVEKGDFEILVGPSSACLPLKQRITW